MLKDESNRQILIKWNEKMLQKTALTSSNYQKFKQFLNAFDKYYRREKRYAMDVWWHHTKVKVQSRNILIKFVHKSMNLRKKEAMLMWSNLVVEQDHQMQLNAQAAQFSVLHLTQAMFYAWREETKNLRRMRFSLMLRVFKALDNNRHATKLKTREMIQLLRTEKEVTSNTIEMCFNALKLNKE